MTTEDLSIPDFKMRDHRAFMPRFTEALPKNDRILVRPIVERLSETLEVQSDKRDRIVKGEVLALGPKVRSELAVGDIVFFSQIERYQVRPDLWVIRDNNLAFVEEPS